MTSTKTSTFIFLSKVISNFFNPLTSLLIYFLYYSVIHYTKQEALAKFSPIAILVILPIVLYLYYKVKKGTFSNFDVSNRQERKTFYFFLIASVGLYVGYSYFVQHLADIVMFYLLILLLVMQISNYFIKSSMHTAFNIFVAALFYSQNELFGFIWLIITIIVGFTRIILKKHTILEVILGAIIGLSISFFYLYTHINLKH